MGQNRYIKGAAEYLKNKAAQIKHRVTGDGFYAGLRGSPREALAALYAEIQSYNYFDEDWYRLVYRDEMEFPDDALHDYIWAGIPNGRDPSPYFNTVLYRRTHHIPLYLALKHFLHSGQKTDSGAYRDEQALLSAQKTFRGQTETTLVKDYRNGAKPFAVYLQSGADSAWKDWQPSPNQTWHMLVNHFEPDLVGQLQCDVEFHQVGSNPGTKFTSFYNILEKYQSVLTPYEYILLLDDDVQLDNEEINSLFSIVQQHGWEMAQASLSADSHCSFPVFFNRNKSGWRMVNGVEIMMPVYSTRLLSTVKQLVSQSISGWGFDSALAMVASQQGFRAAVIDDIVARHLKPTNADIGPYYQMLHQSQIYPEIEFTHLQKKYRFVQPLFYEV